MPVVLQGLLCGVGESGFVTETAVPVCVCVCLLVCDGECRTKTKAKEIPDPSKYVTSVQKIKQININTLTVNS